MNIFAGIASLYQTFFYQPLFNVLILLVVYVPGRDFGVAIILLTIVIRMILYPLMDESIRVQKITRDLNPKIKEIQEKYKKDKEQAVLCQMKLYKEYNINPLGGLIVTFIQLPVLIALYQVFMQGSQPVSAGQLYSFVPNPGALNPMFLGFLNLSQPSIILVAAAGILQYYQSKMFFSASGKGAAKCAPDAASAMEKQMLYILPVVTVAIFWNLPAALSLYIVVTSVFSIIQQKIIFKKLAGAKGLPLPVK